MQITLREKTKMVGGNSGGDEHWQSVHEEVARQPDPPNQPLHRGGIVHSGKWHV